MALSRFLFAGRYSAHSEEGIPTLNSARFHAPRRYDRKLWIVS